MDELQAAFLREKLKRLDADNLWRRRIADLYLEKLAGIPELSLPKVSEDSDSVWHLFVVKSMHRETLRKALDDDGIKTLIHYPVVPYDQCAYKDDSTGAGLDISSILQHQVLSLPIGPTLSLEKARYVAMRVKHHLAAMGS